MLCISRLDIIGQLLVYAGEHIFIRIVIGQHRVFLTFEDVEGIGFSLPVAQNHFCFNRSAVVEGIDGLWVEVLQEVLACIFKLGDVLDFAGFVVFSMNVQGLGLEAQVDVFGHQDHAPIFFMLLEVEGSIQDFVVVFFLPKDHVRIQVVVGVHQHLEVALGFSIEWRPLVDHVVHGQGVKETDKFPRFKVLRVVALFELVELLEYRDRDDHVVLSKVHDGIMGVQDH